MEGKIDAVELSRGPDRIQKFSREPPEGRFGQGATGGDATDASAGHYLYVRIGREDRQRPRHLRTHITVQVKYFRTMMDGKVLILAEQGIERRNLLLAYAYQNSLHASSPRGRAPFAQLAQRGAARR